MIINWFETWKNFLIFLGVAAWAAPFVHEWWKKRRKPVVSIHFDKDGWIKHSKAALLYRMSIGILVKEADVFIEDMSLIVSHNSGEIRKFKWLHISETVNSVRHNDDFIESKKEQMAIGYNMTKESYVQPIFTFYQEEFQNETSSLFRRLSQMRFNYTQSNSDKNRIRTEQIYLDAEAAYRRHWPFRQGDYLCELTIKTSSKHSFTKSFSFNMDATSSQVFATETLRIALNQLQNDYIAEVKNLALDAQHYWWRFDVIS
jgi:hypothetical protein